jgi:hypothetical protein
MQRLNSQKNFVSFILVAMLIVIVLPATSFGKDRGRRHGRGRDFDNWKCGRFVNCHDARDGRWDGRGRRRNSLSVWDWRNNRSNRWRDRDDRWWNSRDDRQRWNRRDYSRRWSSRYDSDRRSNWDRSNRWRRN